MNKATIDNMTEIPACAENAIMVCRYVSVVGTANVVQPDLTPRPEMSGLVEPG